MKTNRFKIFSFTGAVALVLFFAVVNATALTNSTITVAANVAKSSPAKNTLTPAVTVASPASSAGEDIRDIRQPKHVPTPWPWIVIAAGVTTLLITALVVWRCSRQGRTFELSPSQLALERLEKTRYLLNPEHAREYCFAVSQIIRGYIEDQLCLRAPRLTTEEFLRELVEGQAGIAGEQSALLGDFLGHCDLAKFAGWHYSQEALSDMHDTAIEFVQQSAVAKNRPVVSAPEIPVIHQEHTLTHTATNHL
jgi:hypothetical protein